MALLPKGWRWKRRQDGSVYVESFVESPEFVEELKATADKKMSDDGVKRPDPEAVRGGYSGKANYVTKNEPIFDRYISALEYRDPYMTAPQYRPVVWSGSTIALTDEDRTRMALIDRQPEKPIEQIQLGRRARIDEED